MKQISFLLAASCLAIAGCSPAADKAAPPPSETASEAPAAAAARPAAGDLSLGGLGGVEIGQAVAAQTGWEASGNPSDGCVTARSKEYSGVYALIEGNKVRRITAGEGSNVTLAEGITVGSAEADVKAKFPSFKDEPHKYEAAPAKYIATPDIKPGASGIRFEINSAGKVGAIHIGQMPALAYVEGCG